MDGPCSNGLPPFGCCRMRASYLFLRVEYATPKVWDEQSVLIFNLMIHWVPLCVSVLRTLILTMVFTG